MAAIRGFVMAAAFLTTIVFGALAWAQTQAGSTAPAAPTSPPAAVKDKSAGLAAYYNDVFHGRPTASKEIYNKHALTAAINHHPFGTRLKVTNLKNDKSVVVRVNDRMLTKSPCIIDVSRQTAKQLGFVRAGLTNVKLEVVTAAKKK